MRHRAFFFFLFICDFAIDPDVVRKTDMTTSDTTKNLVNERLGKR